MAWYRIGTVSVTLTSPAVTGAGTAWAANIQAGDAFLAPDNKTYEVQSVNSDTSITLATNYTGTTASAQTYAIIPTQGRVRDLAAQVLALVNDYGDTKSALTVVSGRVGLGKSPHASAKLDVAGEVRVDAPTGDATLRMLVNAAEKGKLAVTSAGRVYVESNGAEVMSLLNGNVGVGTAAPTKRLHVGTAAAVVGEAGVVVEGVQGGYGAGISFQSRLVVSNAITEMGRLVWDGEAAWSSANINTQNSYARLMVAKNGATVEALRVDSAGNHGIGGAPTNRLDVFHAVNGIGMRLRNSTTGVELSTRTDATTAGIDAGNATGGMTFSINTTERMRIAAAGNVTIAAPSSGTALTVSGARPLELITAGAQLFMARASDGSIVGSLGSRSGGAFSFYNAGGSTSEVIVTGGEVQLWTAAASRLVVGAAGNVTIAAPSSGIALAVSGALALANLTSVAASTYALLAGDSTLRIQVNCTLNLPAASSFPGRRLRVLNVSSASLVSAASDVIPQGGSAGGTAILAATAGKWAELESNGSGWWVVMSN